MSDRSPDTQDAPPTTQSGEINPSRRKLTGAALGVSAVFTLASRPVWANQCTISGMASGNLSAPKGAACEGCKPEYWKNKKDQWVSKCGVKDSDKFKDVFRCDDIYKKDGRSCTMYEVLKKQGNCNELGSQAVAAYLNAAHSHVNYGYTAGEITDLFRKNYASNATKLLTSLEMLNSRICPLG